MVEEFLQFDSSRGGAKMNFTILTSSRVWGIKSMVINSVDSESGQIIMIGPPRGQLGAGQNELPYFDLDLSVGYQMLCFE